MTEDDKELTLAAARALKRHEAELAEVKAAISGAPPRDPKKDETPEGKAALAALRTLLDRRKELDSRVQRAREAREAVRRELVSPEFDRAQTAAHNAVLAAKDSLRKAREKLELARVGGGDALTLRWEAAVAEREADVAQHQALLERATKRVDAEVALLCGEAS